MGASDGELEIDKPANRTEVSTGHRLRTTGEVIYRAGDNQDKRDFPTPKAIVVETIVVLTYVLAC
jgi:hypothetical protein